MKNKSILKVAMAALLLVAITACRDTSKNAKQSPQVSSSKTVAPKVADALPEAPSSPVLDMVGVLSPEDVREIAEKSVEFDSLKLAQVAVVVVDDLKGMKALDYATALANKWGVGHKETNNGITIVVKPKTPEAKGEVAIATGKGMGGFLPDMMCESIINKEMIPRFKENKYGEAVKVALDKIKEILTRDKD